MNMTNSNAPQNSRKRPVRLDRLDNTSRIPPIIRRDNMPSGEKTISIDLVIRRIIESINITKSEYLPQYSFANMAIPGLRSLSRYLVVFSK